MESDHPGHRHPAPNTRRAPSIRRRLLAFAALILMPVVIGALVSGGVLLHSASRSEQLGAEVVQESRASVALLQALHAARVAGSGYMEEGESDELADFDRAAVAVAVATRASSVFDEPLERAALRGAQARVARRRRPAAPDPGRLRAGAGGRGGPRGRLRGARQRRDRTPSSGSWRTRRTRPTRSSARPAGRPAGRRWPRWWRSLVALATAVALASRMAAALPRPLEQLTRAVRALGAGDLDQHIPEAPSAELRELGETFNRMAAALREQHEQLERQAFTDPLTGVPNRALFERRARAALERGRGTVGVLMIDLDDFKLVNDGLGHLSGDLLIRLAAERISAAARPSDTVARLGGDEFAVLLEDLRGLDDALAAAERLRRRFDAPFDLDGSQVVVSASIGVALAHGSRRPGRAAAPRRPRDVPRQGARQGRHDVLRPADGGSRGRPARRRQRPARRARPRRAGGALPADRRARRAAMSSPPRRCCAGSGPATASCRRSTSSRWPRRPG